MKDILLKRNKLKDNSKKLRVIKFDDTIDNKIVDKIMEEQEKVYKKYKFYDGMAKALNNKKK